jgi:hexosaminidase
MVKLKVGAALLAIVVGIILAVEAFKHIERNPEEPAIVPLPEHIERTKGSFTLGPSTRIVVNSFSELTGEFLAQRLRKATGYDLPLSKGPADAAEQGTIIITDQGAKTGLGSEGYELKVVSDKVTIRGTGTAGIFYGTQSLLQMLPPEIFSESAVRGRQWTIRCLRLEDQPRFAWRGVMLDVSRHFFNPAEIKHLLDAMALHKLNIFHWHLTDNQGWRIEIKKYPRLTEVGAWRKRIGFNLDPKAATAYGPDGRYGGYYTQAEVLEIVAYARSLHITIVPEIEMPGHSSAALAAYPELSCSGGPYTTDMSEAVSAGVFCAGKDASFEFLENVLTEVIELFPGEFIHIGGDEVAKQNWKNCPRCQARMAQDGIQTEHELQSYFVRRIETFVNARGKRLIGWSEIRDDNLSKRTALMDWTGGGLEAARAGYDVVMSPQDYCYLDFYQSKDHSSEPPAAGAYLPLAKVYSFEPIPANLEASQREHILGAQANIWTEYMPSLSQVEYMAFPRLCALAEVVWSPKASSNWQDFTRRLAIQEQRLDRMGINYRRTGPLKTGG